MDNSRLLFFDSRSRRTSGLVKQSHFSCKTQFVVFSKTNSIYGGGGGVKKSSLAYGGLKLKKKWFYNIHELWLNGYKEVLQLLESQFELAYFSYQNFPLKNVKLSIAQKDFLSRSMLGFIFRHS